MNGKRGLSFVALTLVAVLIPMLDAREFVHPTIPVTWRPGACDDGFMSPMEPFVKQGNAEIARRRTRMMFTYDTEFLRVCLNPREIDVAAVRLAFARGRPERVRDDDSVSAYVRLAGKVHEFTVASDGKLDEVLWDGRNEDASWTGGATWSVARPDEWMGFLGHCSLESTFLRSNCYIRFCGLAG